MRVSGIRKTFGVFLWVRAGGGGGRTMVGMG